MEVAPAAVPQDLLSKRSTRCNYVGVMRIVKHLQRATVDMGYLMNRMTEFYRKAHMSPLLLGLRNGIQTAIVVVEAALTNRKSRGTHYIA